MTGSTRPPFSLDQLKRQAKRLRARLAEDGDFISHSESLELIARQLGYRDWNALHGAVGNRAAPLTLGSRVKGRYLGQPFTGEVVAARSMSGDYRQLTIKFDTPVDVVTFPSFSAFRSRVSATINQDGVSPARTSNGAPQLVLETG